MRNFAVFGPPRSAAEGRSTRVELEGVAIDCRIVETPDPVFDPGAASARGMALVRKRGFSLNYRDRPFILGSALRAPAGSFAVLGSEFVGEIIACGPDAGGLQAGERVIANNAYPDSGVPGLAGGLPGNMLSKELQILPAAKLARIPESMSDAEAAGFSIGAQTTFSMVRKLALAPGAAVLVTGGRANTSLFAIAALRALDLDPPVLVWASTTSERSAARLRELGVKGVFRIDPTAPSFMADEAGQRVVLERGGFDAVIDPFFDIHLPAAAVVLKSGGRYVTCGLYEQTGHLVPHRRTEPPRASGVMSMVVFKNLQIIGNCLGSTADLERALAAYAAGRFPMILDSVYTDGDAPGFLDRTYNAPERFGKVVYLYH